MKRDAMRNLLCACMMSVMCLMAAQGARAQEARGAGSCALVQALCRGLSKVCTFRCVYVCVRLWFVHFAFEFGAGSARASWWKLIWASENP